NVHDQVPSACFATVPTDADSVTTSRPGSNQLPAFIAVCPSSTVTVAWSRVTVGATLFTVNSKVTVDTSPSLSVAVMATVCDSSGPSLVSNAHFQVPSAFRVTLPTDADSETAS